LPRAADPSAISETRCQAHRQRWFFGVGQLVPDQVHPFVKHFVHDGAGPWR
jgi:hypothetical protein